MPRQARLDIPGALHHIMVRGINKADIFEDYQDRALFLRRGATLMKSIIRNNVPKMFIRFPEADMRPDFLGLCNKGEQWYDLERIADRVAET